MALFKLYYPSESSITYSYLPSLDPDVGLGEGPNLGVMQHRVADGQLQTYGVFTPRPHRRRPFTKLTAADKAARDTFFIATRGLPIRYTDELIFPAYVTVKATGASLDDDWTSEGAGFWGRVEEFEETTAVPTLADLGDIRVGYVDFTGSEIDKVATLTPGPFADGNYLPHLTPVQSTPSGELISAYIKAGSIAAATFSILLAAAPGAGNTVRVYYEALHF